LTGRYLKEWEVVQRVLSLKLFSDSMDAASITAALSRELVSLDVERVVAWHCDTVNANTLAMNTVAVVSPKSVHVKCLSHSYNNVGLQFACPVLDDFMIAWNNIVHSKKGLNSGYVQQRDCSRRLSSAE